MREHQLYVQNHAKISQMNYCVIIINDIQQYHQYIWYQYTIYDIFNELRFLYVWKAVSYKDWCRNFKHSINLESRIRLGTILLGSPNTFVTLTHVKKAEAFMSIALTLNVAHNIILPIYDICTFGLLQTVIKQLSYTIRIELYAIVKWGQWGGSIGRQSYFTKRLL